MTKELGLRVQVRIIPLFGPGKMLLLDGVERFGSISAAARALNMPYARAWRLIEATNARFSSPLVRKAPGGQGGGGAELTETGRAVLGILRSMEAKAKIMFASDMEALDHLLAPMPVEAPCGSPDPEAGRQAASPRKRRRRQA